MSPLLYSLIAVFLISIISLSGVFFLSLDTKKLSKISLLLVSFATGAMLGDAFIHLIPESYENFGFGIETSVYILSGLMIFFVLEKFMHWRHCHIQDSDNHVHPVATLNIIGDLVHNLIDGMLIGASFLIDPSIGIATSVAIILHEIPQEIGDFAILVHSGMKVKKALMFNFLSSLFAFLGVGIVYILGSQVEGFENILLPITAGGFIYIAGTDLLPELKHHVKWSHSILQFGFIILGLLLMAALTMFE